VRALSFCSQAVFLSAASGCLDVSCEKNPAGSFQHRVLRLSLLQDGDVGVGVVPEREEILIGRLRVGRVSRNDFAPAAASFMFACTSNAVKNRSCTRDT